MIAKTAIIHPSVKIGKNREIEDFVIIGTLRDGLTTIGDNAIIRSHTVIYGSNIIGNNFQTGNKANIREYNTIGDNVSIGTLSIVEHHVIIGNGVRIHSQVFIPEFTVLEDNCWIGPNVVITNAKYPKSSNVKKELKGALVKKNAIIGANCTLLPGVEIGEHAIVGAGSVVTKNVINYSVVAGNPAVPINSVNNLLRNGKCIYK